MNRNWSVLNWNIRGINDDKKWLAIANKISESDCSIVTLQETKTESFDSSYIKQFCLRKLNKFDYLPYVGASGGLITIWNDQLFTGQTILKNDFSLSIEFTSKLNENKWILTNIYGPCQPDKRVVFLNWFQNLQIEDDMDWLVVGDFNYMRYPSNRNKGGGNFQDMMQFNDAISKLALVEIPLKGREFTWSKMPHSWRKLTGFSLLKLRLLLTLTQWLLLWPKPHQIIYPVS